MAFDFATVDAQLDALLVSALPDEWKVLDAANGSLPASLVPVLTYLQTDVSTEMGDARRLPSGYYAVSFVLELTVPEKDLIKAGLHLMRLLPVLFDALDSSAAADLEWSDAAKGVTQGGVAFYSIPITTLTQYTPATPEPDTEE